MTAAIDVEAKTLIIERDFRAPIERVFEAFTNPEQMRQWWGPEGMTIPELDVDLREGGKWKTVMENSEGGQHVVEGVYQTIAPHNRLVYTWGWVTDGVRGPETTVDIALSKIEGGTRMNMTHSLFDTTEIRDNHNGGWSSSLKCLEVFLAA